MNKKVEVYSQPQCPPCTIVKQYLDHHAILYTEYNVKQDTKARNRMINEYNSFSTPTVVINGKVITGFDIPALEQLLQK